MADNNDIVEIESLQNLTRKQISELLTKFFETTEATVMKDEHGIVTAILPCLNEKIPEVRSKISIGASLYMDKYIEEELEDNPTKYNRTAILFESQPGENVIFFRWFQ
jgi:hypothetical protein